MNIYLIKEVGEDNYKIGICRDIKERLTTLQTGNPRELEVLFVLEVENASRLENKLHKEYKDKHIKGEWFKDIEMKDFQRKVLLGQN